MNSALPMTSLCPSNTSSCHPSVSLSNRVVIHAIEQGIPDDLKERGVAACTNRHQSWTCGEAEAAKICDYAPAAHSRRISQDFGGLYTGSCLAGALL